MSSDKVNKDKGYTIDCNMCGACCIAFDIAALGKKAGERCKYLGSDNKCSIHKDPKRPWACAGVKPDEVCVLISSYDQDKKVEIIKKIYGID